MIRGLLQILRPSLSEQLGLGKPEDLPRDQLARVIVQLAETSARAGVSPPWWAWLRWTPLERASWAEGAERVARSRAVEAGLAAAGPESAAAVYSEIDGGASLLRFKLEEGIQLALGKAAS